MWYIKLKKCIYDKFILDNSGMGVVEIILIILVLMGLVLIFRTQINSVIKTIFEKITTQLNDF